MDFANLFSVILLLVAAGLTVLAGLPMLRKWQRERDSGARRAGGRAHHPVEEGPAGHHGADAALEEQGRLDQPDQPRLGDRLVDRHHAHDDQDEQMRNRPADEQHHRPSRFGGARQRPAEEPDPRHAPAMPVNGHAYGGFDDADDVHGDLPVNDANGRYEPVEEPDDARRGAHFDWKVAAQYERARAARNASMSSFEPPPLPNDGPGTFTEEIPAIHAADGQRRHPAVHADPDAPVRQPFDQQRHGGPPVNAPPQARFQDPWGSDAAPPPAFEFDEQQQYEPYDEHGPDPRGFGQPQAPYEPFGPEPGDADDLAPPPHMRWRPDPEPDIGPMDAGAYGAPPGQRQAFAATTFRVQPAAEEPVSVHVAEAHPVPDPAAGPGAGFDPEAGPLPDPSASDPALGRYGAPERVADPASDPAMGRYAAPGQADPRIGEAVDPASGYAGVVGDDRQADGWADDDTTGGYVPAEPAHGYAGGYAPAGPGTGYEPRQFGQPVGPPAATPVFGGPVDAGDAEPAQAFSRGPRDGGSLPVPVAPQRPPLPDLSPLLAADEVAELRMRWNEVKGTFPDDPVTAVQEASKLVGEFTKLFERRLGVDPDSTDVSTEDLRLALQRYLAFFERLLSS